MKNAVVEEYCSFNPRRYSNPWVCRVDERGKLDFSVKVGAYTGAYGKGEAGSLYVFDPVVGGVYAYGQKDYRGNNGGYAYIKWDGTAFVPVEKKDLLEALNQVS